MSCRVRISVEGEEEPRFVDVAEPVELGDVKPLRYLGFLNAEVHRHEHTAEDREWVGDLPPFSAVWLGWYGDGYPLAWGATPEKAVRALAAGKAVQW